MGRFLDIIDMMERRAEPGESLAVESRDHDINDINDKSPTGSADFGRISRLCRTPSAFTAVLTALERRCPDYVEPKRWQQAVEDGRRFVTRWGDQAAALGWTERDLFGLHEPPAGPHPSYSRLSRLDHTGLIWLLRGRPVLALTAATTTIKCLSGAPLVFHKAGPYSGTRSAQYAGDGA